MVRARAGSGTRRVLMAVVAFAALAAGLVAFMPSASAHHPEIEGAAECADTGGYLVSFLSESWQKYGGNQGGGANPSIGVSYRLRTGGGSPGPWVDLPADANYRYRAENGYQFSDQFPVTDLSGGDRVQLRATALANWGNGNPGGQQTTSGWIDLPDDCRDPGVPVVDATTACVAGDGRVTVTLTNSAGSEPIEFVVTDPRTQDVTTVSVAPGGSEVVVLEGLADGAHTIPVTADGEPYEQDVLVACDQPGLPEVSSTVECVDGDGRVVVTLASAGGTEPIEFVVTDPRTQDVTTVSVAPGGSEVVVLEGLADGAHTIPVRADGVDHDQQVAVDCDRPGTPQVSTSVACVDGDGDVTVTLANLDGDLPVEFEVVDPRGGTAISRTVAVGATTDVVLEGLPDGTHDIEVTADGEPLDQTVTVDCDRPGEPELGASVACVDGDGEVSVVLANTGGDLPVEFVVTHPRTGATTTRTVDPGDIRTVVLRDLPDGTHTIAVRADGAAHDQEVEVDCDRPGVPDVAAEVECVDGDGDIAITLRNTGGDEPVRFVVIDPRDDSRTRRRVAPAASRTVTLEGFGDGMHTIGVTADGVSLDQTVVVGCDRPGEPEVQSSHACNGGDGDIAVVLRTTGGDLPVEFVVTDPRDGSSVVRVVGPGQSVEVVLEGFDDGVHVVEVTADGKSYDQEVEVACDEPGVPAVEIDAECVDFDGEVEVTLANTGGTEPIEFVVTDPRDGSTSTRTVAVGDTASLVFDGLDDGSYTIEVTADGTSLDQQVTVACDRPGDPAASAASECTADGGLVAVTLENLSPAGEAEPVIFVVVDPRDGSEHAEAVQAGRSKVVQLEGFDDGEHVIEVTADGEPLVALDVVVDCGRPTADGPSLRCAEGGAVLTLTNSGTVPVVVEVLVDDVPTALVTVPAGDTSEVLVPLEEDQTVNLKVVEGDVVLLDEDVDFDCEEPVPFETTTTEDPGRGTTTRVLAGGAELAEPAPAVQAAALPVTGGSLVLAVAAVALIAAGGLVLVVRRRLES